MNQEKIGKFIRKIRNERKMTQQELAEKIGITDRAISKWENGRGMPDIMFLIPLSNSLGITVLELLNGEKNVDENNAVVKLIKQNERATRLWKYLFVGIINIILIIMLIILFFGYIIPNKYENSKEQGITKIISESMKPTLNINENIIYDKVSINSVKENDIVAYYYLDSNGNIIRDFVNVHRVIRIEKDKNENINLITKGDYNTEIDDNYVSNKNYLGIYNHKTSNLTNVFLKYDSKLSKSIVVFLIIGILSILFIDILQFKDLLIINNSKKS